MAQWRDFDATNKPDTCVWCGQKLRWKTHGVSKPIDMPWEEWWKHPDSKVNERRYDKPGDYGDGFFCGLRCGYMFGERLAQLGRRLQGRTPA